jgi:hypothetical protein
MDNQAELRQRTCCRCCDRSRHLPPPRWRGCDPTAADRRRTARNLYRSHLIERGQRGKLDTVDLGVDARARFALIPQKAPVGCGAATAAPHNPLRSRLFQFSTPRNYDNSPC